MTNQIRYSDFGLSQNFIIYGQKITAPHTRWA